MSRKRPSSELIDVSFTEIARPSNDDVRRTTLAQIRSGQLKASVTTAAGIKPDTAALRIYEQYESDLKTLLVALEQRDTYRTLYTELLKERNEARAASVSGSGSQRFCPKCAHCVDAFFD